MSDTRTGASWIGKIQRRKEKHIWAKLVMDELIERASLYKYDYTGKNSFVFEHDNDMENKDSHVNKKTIEKKRSVSPILIAA